jgi:sortase A
MSTGVPGNTMRSLRNTLAYAFLAVGIVLFCLGARELIISVAGQKTAEAEFEVHASANRHQSLVPVREGDIVGRLSIPRLGAELFVVEGDGSKDLRRGPGHVTGTAMPGAMGNCVIAGHRDTHFRVLKDIRDGDEIILETTAGKFLYRVRKTEIVLPEDNQAMQDTADPELNLITCYPFYYVGAAPRRFVVQARLAGAVGSASAQPAL